MGTMIKSQAPASNNRQSDQKEAAILRREIAALCEAASVEALRCAYLFLVRLAR